MSSRPLKDAGAATRGDGDAGADACGRARHEAIADDAARAAKVRRNAWLLGALAAFFYLGYMAWMFLRGAG